MLKFNESTTPSKLEIIGQEGVQLDVSKLISAAIRITVATRVTLTGINFNYDPTRGRRRLASASASASASAPSLIFVSNGELVLNNCTFNHLAFSAISVSGGTVTLNGCNFMELSASAVVATGGDTAMWSSAFTGNRAIDGNGAALAIREAAKATAHRLTFVNNLARRGGAVFIDGQVRSTMCIVPGLVWLLAAPCDARGVAMRGELRCEGGCAPGCGASSVSPPL